jgi:hypothetical protein
MQVSLFLWLSSRLANFLPLQDQTLRSLVGMLVYHSELALVDFFHYPTSIYPLQFCASHHVRVILFVPDRKQVAR